MIAAVLVLVLQGQESDPPAAGRRPRTVQSAVRIFIEETPEEPYAHDYYEQAAPVEARSGTATLGSSVWYRTVCRPQEDDRSPIVFTVPEQQPLLTLSGTLAAPRVNVSIQSGTITPGRPRRDPIVRTKTGLFGGSDSTSDGRDTPYLIGTDLDYVAVPDVTGWNPASWLPEQTSVHLYARALFGSLEIADLTTDLQLYSVGPRLGVPIARWGSLDLDCTISAGPGYLHTGVGDAIGFDGGIGLRVSRFFTRSLSFIAELEANYFRGGNVTAFGPVVNLGFNLSW
jgi:hypothetical protein